MDRFHELVASHWGWGLAVTCAVSERPRILDRRHLNVCTYLIQPLGLDGAFGLNSRS